VCVGKVQGGAPHRTQGRISRPSTPAHTPTTTTQAACLTTITSVVRWRWRDRSPSPTGKLSPRRPGVCFPRVRCRSLPHAGCSSLSVFCCDPERAVEKGTRRRGRSATRGPSAIRRALVRWLELLEVARLHACATTLQPHGKRPRRGVSKTCAPCRVRKSRMRCFSRRRRLHRSRISDAPRRSESYDRWRTATGGCTRWRIGRESSRARVARPTASPSTFVTEKRWAVMSQLSSADA
jgi:hypothetical protein